MMTSIGHFINGEVIHEDNSNIKVFNPSNGKVISSINCASKNIIEKAIIHKMHSMSGNLIL